MSPENTKEYPAQAAWMSREGSNDEMESSGGSRPGNDPARNSGRTVFLIFWALTFVMIIAPGEPWHGWRGVLLTVAGLTILIRPPRVQVPRLSAALAGAFMVLACMVFLPAGWFHLPAWRETLAANGLASASSVTVQPLLTAEALSGMAVCLIVLVYLTGHRVDHGGNHLLALAFAAGVAVVTLFAMGAHTYHWAVPWVSEDNYNFGFFTNRNHMATLLVMGIMAAAGVAMQSLRVRTWGSGICALLAMAVCVIGVLGYSQSRAGVVLLAGVFSVWLLLLGREYLRGRVLAAAIIAAAAATVFYATKESAVKNRLSETASQLSILAAGNENDGALKEGTGSLQSFEMRVPIYLDTLGMLWHEPWTGVGAGQFQYVFPQYRQRSAVMNDRQSVHPESDWLLIAAEAGIPAMLVLAALLTTTGGSALRSALKGRARALRTGCLMAAAVVPLHGLFDVPGHRMELVWPACLLVAITLRGSREILPASGLSRAVFRGLGVAVVAAGAFLVYCQWFGGPVPATLLSHRTTEKVRALYTEEMAALKASGGNPPAETAPEDDRLENAIRTLDAALKIVPMDSRLHCLKGALCLSFDDRDADADREFTLARMLDPTWIAMPLIQGTAWAPVDPARTESLWKDAMKRAESLEQIDPATSYHRKMTFARLLRDAAGFSGLAGIALRASGNDFALLDEWVSQAPRDSLDATIPDILSTSIPEPQRQLLLESWSRRGSKRAVEQYTESHPRLAEDAKATEETPPAQDTLGH